jgi:hypothetical protein
LKNSDIWSEENVALCKRSMLNRYQ